MGFFRASSMKPLRKAAEAFVNKADFAANLIPLFSPDADDPLQPEFAEIRMGFGYEQRRTGAVGLRSSDLKDHWDSVVISGCFYVSVLLSWRSLLAIKVTGDIDLDTIEKAVEQAWAKKQRSRLGRVSLTLWNEFGVKNARTPEEHLTISPLEAFGQSVGLTLSRLVGSHKECPEGMRLALECPSVQMVIGLAIVENFSGFWKDELVHRGR